MAEKLRRLTKRTIDALKPAQTAWDGGDGSVKGFGVRRQRRNKVYMLKYRIAGRQRWFVIGQHGSPWTVEQARTEAKRLLGIVAVGVDPAAARAQSTEARRSIFTSLQWGECGKGRVRQSAPKVHLRDDGHYVHAFGNS
jgi:hypothetical protein